MPETRRQKNLTKNLDYLKSGFITYELQVVSCGCELRF